MTKIITTLVIVLMTIFTLNAQNKTHLGSGTSIEVDFNGKYRIYKVLNSKKEFQSAKNQVIKLLFSEGLIDYSTTDMDEINTEKTENDITVYHFKINEEVMDILLNENLLSKSKFKSLKNSISTIYHDLKSEYKYISKSDTKIVKKENNKSTHRKKSFSLNIDIENSKGNYKLTSRYNEDGQYEKLIAYITGELGSKNLKKYHSHYQWSKKVNGDYAYFISVYKGKFKVVIDHEYLENDLFSSIKNIAEFGKIIINSDSPETPKPPKPPKTPKI